MAVPELVIEAISRQHRGWASYCLGRVDEALADFDAAARAASRAGSAREAAYSELSRAMVLCELPDPESGLALARELRTRGRAQGLPDVAHEWASCSPSATSSRTARRGRPPAVRAGGRGDAPRPRLAVHPVMAAPAPGRAAGALPLERETYDVAFGGRCSPTGEVIDHVRVLDAGGLPDEAVGITREYMLVCPTRTVSSPRRVWHCSDTSG